MISLEIKRRKESQRRKSTNTKTRMTRRRGRVRGRAEAAELAMVIEDLRNLKKTIDPEEAASDLKI